MPIAEKKRTRKEKAIPAPTEMLPEGPSREEVGSALFPANKTARLDFRDLDLYKTLGLLGCEAKASLFSALFAGIGNPNFYGSWVYRGGTLPLAEEQKALIAYFEQEHPGIRFGNTFERARRAWHHVATYEACLTDLGAEEFNEEFPNPCKKCIAEGKEATCKHPVAKRGDPTSTSEIFISPWSLNAMPGPNPGFWGASKAPFRERLNNWIEEVITEVREGLVPFADDAMFRPEFTRMIEQVRGFQPGNGQGQAFMERLVRDQRGIEILATFNTGKARLLERLEMLRDELAPVEQPTAATTMHDTMERMTWNGEVQVLAWLMRELFDKGWLPLPTHGRTTEKWKKGDLNAQAAARLLGAHFEVNEATLAQELKKEGSAIRLDKVRGFSIPKREP